MDPHRFVKAFHGIRYQVKDVARAAVPAFASVTIGGSQILLNVLQATKGIAFLCEKYQDSSYGLASAKKASRRSTGLAPPRL